MNESKSIAFLLGNLTMGGSEKKIVRLANRLSEKGHDIHIIAIGEPYTLHSQIHKRVSIHCLDRRFKYSLRALLNLKRYLVINHIETILCVNLYPLLYGWPVCVLLGTGSHRCLAAVNTSELRSFRDKIFMVIYSFILRRCDIVIFGSNGQKDAWVGKYSLDGKRAVVVYNGVDTALFQKDEEAAIAVRRNLDIDARTKVIGCVAQLRPEKAHRNLIIALNHIVNSGRKRVVLLIVGDGPEEKKLRNLVAHYELSDHVRFVGKVDDVRPYLSVFDLFALTSTSVEVFSNAVLEAMSMGIPVVSSDVGGVSEMITHGKEGFIYSRNDLDALISHLQLLIENASLSSSFSASAKERVAKYFTAERMNADYIRLLGLGCG